MRTIIHIWREARTCWAAITFNRKGFLYDWLHVQILNFQIRSNEINGRTSMAVRLGYYASVCCNVAVAGGPFFLLTPTPKALMLN